MAAHAAISATAKAKGGKIEPEAASIGALERDAEKFSQKFGMAPDEAQKHAQD